MSDPYEFVEDCWNCGGEGFYYSCVDEIGCIDPESGCDLCMRRCDICNPPKPRALSTATRNPEKE